MNIKGLQKTTLLDYPGHVAATVFIGGCNFRCPFCHNMNIVESCNAEDNNGRDEISEEELFLFLQKRRGILDGVCITGGEPTLYNELPEFIGKIKNLGYAIKLDTNGTNPDMLKNLVKKRLIDYVAMDIKASYDKYMKVAGIDDGIKLIDKVKKSVEYLKSGVIEHEFRTTIVEQYHDEEEIKKIGEILQGEDRYFLQSFKESEYVTDKTLTSADKETVEKYVELLKKYINNPEIRGI